MQSAGPPQLIELKCRNCGSPLSPENISPQLAAARCPHCRALFAIHADGPPPVPKPDVPLPKGFSLREYGGSLEITRRWIGPAAFFLLIFALFWNGFMIVWHGIALSQGEWIMSAFGLIHTAVGIGVAYFTLALFINTTRIRAGLGKIEVRHGPLPWKGNKTISSVDIPQLYCMEKIIRGKNGTSSRYRIEAILPDNRRETLVDGFTDSDHALYVEQQLERHLRISDQPVAGGYGR